MKDLDDQLDQAAAAVWAAVEDTHLSHHQPRPRRPLALIGAVAIVVAGAVGIIGMTTWPGPSIVSTNDAQPQQSTEFSSLVVGAANRLGWSFVLPDDLISSSTPREATVTESSMAGRSYSEVKLRDSDGWLLVSRLTGDPSAVKAGSDGRADLLRTDGTATVYLGTDGPNARAVELFDGDTIIYVRSQTAAPAALNDLIELALKVDDR